VPNNDSTLTEESNTLKKAEAETVQCFSEDFLKSHTLWFSQDIIKKTIDGSETKDQDLKEIATFIAPYYNPAEVECRTLLSILLTVDAYFALYRDSADQSHIAIFLPKEVLESAGIEGNERNIFIISALATVYADNKSESLSGIDAIHELKAKNDENKYLLDIQITMEAFPPTVSIYDPIVSEWVLPMLAIFDRIKEAGNTFQDSMIDFDIYEAKDVISISYLDTLSSLVTEIKSLPATDTSLDEYNTTLEESLLAFHQLCSNLKQEIDNETSKHEDEILARYYVLSNLSEYSDFKELDKSFQDYSDNINRILEEVTGKNWGIDVDLSISSSLDVAIDTSNRTLLWFFAHNYMPTLDIIGQELDSSLINDEDKLDSMDYGLSYYENTARPYYDKVVEEFSGTLLDKVCSAYGLFLDDYYLALDYSLRSLNELAEMQDALTNQDRLLKRDFYRWEPFFEAKNWYVFETETRGNTEIIVGTIHANETNPDLWNRICWLKYDISAMFSDYSIEDAYNLYIESLKDSFRETEGNPAIFYSTLNLTQNEYAELKALVENGISLNDFNLKLATVQQDVNEKVEKYQGDYYDFVYYVSDLVDSYGYDLIDLINQPFDSLSAYTQSTTPESSEINVPDSNPSSMP